MNLSKSLYTRGIQCPKSLWLKKYKPEVLTPPSLSQKARFAIGDAVGDLACQLFPGGKEIAYDPTQFGRMIAQTKQWIEEGVEYIYEATFSYGGILIMVDILRVTEDGFELYEVKSATSVKDIYRHDLSIQYYVLSSMGYRISCASIIHIDTSYVRGETLDLSGLFSIVDITAGIVAMQEEIPRKLREFDFYLSHPEGEPDIDIGLRCSSPYDCDAMEYCWRTQRGIPEYSVYNIFRFGTPKEQQLTREGIVRIEDISDDFEMTAAQKLKVENYKSNTPHIDTEKIAAFVETITYPIYHLDFEAMQQAIPQWQGVKPYAQIPFQYSLHIEHEDGTLEHREFLAEAGVDPRRALAERLVEDIPVGVTVLAYSMSFEKGVIGKLAEQFQDLRKHLLDILPSVKDLMLPFQKGYYICPHMKGSYSIKAVMPALVPHMADAYKQLDLVHDGSEAMHTFSQLTFMSAEEHVRAREALLEYCKLDTFAMVEVLRALRRVVS